MPEKPINLKAWEVQAFLKGRKTQKRMVPKPYPDGVWGLDRADGISKVLANYYLGRPWWNVGGIKGWKPRYAVGTVLWARETWSGRWEFRNVKPSERSNVMTPEGPLLRNDIWYWADGNPENGDWEPPRPSTHMPRWAARLFLEVTEVRLERLDDISEEDAKAEGIDQKWTCLNPETGSYAIEQYTTESFQKLWDTDNPKHPWGTNPWVEVYTFKVLEGYK
jgi:hypothetical protein